MKALRFLKKNKFIILFLITLIPMNKLRVFLINITTNSKINGKIGFFNVFLCKDIKITNSKIGSFNIFNANILIIENSKIGSFNKIFNFKKIKITNNSIIGSYNLIKEYNDLKYNFSMNRSQVSNEMNFDLNGNFFLGKNVVFGGLKSYIIKNKKKLNTIFLKNIFIGSSTIILSGTKISSDITIGAKSIVKKNLYKSGFYISKKLKLITNN